MARENVMSTPIFDQLLREMAQRAEPRATPPAQPAASTTPEPPAAAPEPEQPAPTPRGRRHRAD